MYMYIYIYCIYIYISIYIYIYIYIYTLYHCSMTNSKCASHHRESSRASAASLRSRRISISPPSRPHPVTRIHSLEKWRENHGKTMGKPWENHGKTMGKLETHPFSNFIISPSLLEMWFKHQFAGTIPF